jgi:hypothetical protein
MSTRKSIFRAFQKLDSMPAKLAREDAQKRGNQFEELILELFATEKLLRKKSYHTSDGKSEQIDGALKIGGIRALLEVKWVNSGLAASELYAFLGKVEGKFIGTVGIFISREELSPNFLKSLRSGRRQCVIVIHGEDVDHIFNPEFPIKDYLVSTLDCLSFDNQFHFSANDFLRKSKRKTKTNKEIHPLVEKALENKDYTNIINEWVEGLNKEHATELVGKCLDVFLRKGESGEIGNLEKNNIICLLSETIQKLPSKRTDTDWFYFEELSINFVTTVFSDLIEYFAVRYETLDYDEKNIFNKRLINQWKKHIGDYNSENTLATITDPIWPHLDTTTQNNLIKIFLSFIDSGRRTHFPQMKLASKVLSKTELTRTGKIVKELLKENITYWFEDDRKEKNWKEKMPEWYSRQYRKWGPYIKESMEDAIKEVVGELAEETA